MTNRVTIKGLIAAAMVAAGAMASLTGAASAAQPIADPLIGSWTIQGGTTEDGIGVQIRIERIDDRGRATGTYCSTRTDASFFGFELRPKGGVKTSLKRGVLKFARGKQKYALAMNDDGTMRFEYSRKGKKWPTMTMERSETAGCLKRFAAADETATHTVGEGEAGEFAGVWEGKAKNKIKIGIHVASIDGDGQANALHCWTRKDGSMVAFDAGPGETAHSVVEDGKLRTVRGKHSYELVTSGEDKVRHTYRKDGKNAVHTTLRRTTPSGCLTRVRMRDQDTAPAS